MKPVRRDHTVTSRNLLIRDALEVVLGKRLRRDIEMDRFKVLEEQLREAACKGDFDTAAEIISKGVNVDSKNVINGWTALHWAAKRGHKEIVHLLLDQGADPAITTELGETPLSLATSPEIRQILGGDPSVPVAETNLPIQPNYIKSQAAPQKSDYVTNGLQRRQLPPESEYVSHQNDELVLKVRVANSGDPDFIEIEIPKTELTYYTLLRVCCEELGLNVSQVVRLRKLPNTMLRKDKDVSRLSHMQEIEVVVTPASAKHQPNGYKSIQLYKNQTILY